MGQVVSLVASNDDVPSTRRQTGRSRVLLGASVKNAFGEQAVKIRDLSSNGALIEAPVVPPVGSRLLLNRGPIEVLASVVWAGSGRYGLAFHDSIVEAELLIPIAANKGASAPPKLKPLFPAPPQIATAAAR